MSTAIQKGATRDALYRGPKPETDLEAGTRSEAALGAIADVLALLKKDIGNADVTPIEDQTATGSQITPTPVVKVGTTTLTKDTDYAVSYGTNTAVGTGTVTIEGLNGYHGKKVVTFAIESAE